MTTANWRHPLPTTCTSFIDKRERKYEWQRRVSQECFMGFPKIFLKFLRRCSFISFLPTTTILPAYHLFHYSISVLFDEVVKRVFVNTRFLQRLTMLPLRCECTL